MKDKNLKTYEDDVPVIFDNPVIFIGNQKHNEILMSKVLEKVSNSLDQIMDGSVHFGDHVISTNCNKLSYDQLIALSNNQSKQISEIVRKYIISVFTWNFSNLVLNNFDKNIDKCVYAEMIEKFNDIILYDDTLTSIIESFIDNYVSIIGANYETEKYIDYVYDNQNFANIFAVQLANQIYYDMCLTVDKVSNKMLMHLDVESMNNYHYLKQQLFDLLQTLYNTNICNVCAELFSKLMAIRYYLFKDIAKMQIEEDNTK